MLAAQRRTADAEQWAQHSRLVVERAERLRRIVVEGHSSIRALSAVRDLAAEAEPRHALSRLPAELARMRDLVADNPPQQEQLDTAARSAAAYIAWAAGQEQRAAAGRWDAFDAELRAGTGKALIDGFVTDLQRFLTVEQALDADRAAAAAARRRALRGWRLAFMLLTIPLAVFLVWVYATRVGRTLTAVAATERELAQAHASQASELRFRTLADAMPQLVWTARPDGTVDYYNHRYREFGGITPTGRGWDWGPSLYPDDEPATRRAWQRAIATGDPYEIEHRVQRAEGGYRWYVSRGVASRGADGRIHKWYGTTTDIHALKQAEEALRQNEERLRLAAEAARMFAFEWQPGSDVVRRSGDCLDILGGRRDDSGTEYFARLPPADRESLTGAITALTPEQPQYHASYRYVREDGAVLHLEESARGHFDATGRLVRLVGMTADVTARREAERRLSETTAILHAVSDTTADFILVKDLEQRIVFINPSALATIGVKRDAVLGHTEREWHRDLAEAEAIMANDRRILDSGRAESLEETFTGADGATRVYLSRKSALRDADGRVIGVVGISSDITSRVRAEQERRELLAREQAARAEAEQANVLKDQFLATLSHELRTPLNAILGWAQILASRPMDDEQRIRSVLTTIARNAQIQVRLIEDLLDMSRIISGQMRLEVQPVRLPAIVQLAIDAVQPAADARHIALVFRHGPGAAVELRGDPGRLQQVVLNVLTNAVKFTPAHGRVEVALEPHGSGVQLAVVDTGPGIPFAFLPFVFDRFRQADASPTRAHGGLGLGLSIARHIVERHGGSIEAGNAPGGGARIVVQLPAPSLMRMRTATAAVAAGGAPVALAGLRVLAVDDDAETRALLERIFEDHGAHATVAESVDKALRWFDQAAYDVLVVDIAMPARDGYELVREVRRHPDVYRRGVPIVALSAFARAEDRDRARLSGFTAYATKPIAPAQLAALIAQVTGRSSPSVLKS